MALSVPVGPALRIDDIPAAVHRQAARTVVRVLVPFHALLVGLGVLEMVTTGQMLPLQLAALAVLLSTLPGTLIATEAVARFRLDGTLRRMERALSSFDVQDAPGPSR